VDSTVNKSGENRGDLFSIASDPFRLSSLKGDDQTQILPSLKITQTKRLAGAKKKGSRNPPAYCPAPAKTTEPRPWKEETRGSTLKEGLLKRRGTELKVGS